MGDLRLAQQHPTMLLSVFFFLSLAGATAFLPSAPLTGALRTLSPARSRPHCPAHGPQMLFSGLSDEEKAVRAEWKGYRRPPPGSRVVELAKPMGIKLKTGANQNVFIEDINPRGNAGLMEQRGQIAVGDEVVMVSSTFGNEAWSCRGAGKERVESSIRVRSGSTVTLVLESPQNSFAESARARKAQKARAEKAAKEEALRDQLLRENEEKKSKKKGLNFWL